MLLTHQGKTNQGHTPGLHILLAILVLEWKSCFTESSTITRMTAVPRHKEPCKPFVPTQTLEAKFANGHIDIALVTLVPYSTGLGCRPL